MSEIDHSSHLKTHEIAKNHGGFQSHDLKTFIVSAVGGSLEFYDFVVYVFFAQLIANLFFDATSPIGGLLLAFNVYASGYVARIFGGVLFSHFGDKFGRKNSFAFTILLMAIPTFLIGFLPTYQMVGGIATVLLIVCRIAQGLAVGGELPCSITFVFEHAREGRKALACGILFCGVILGIFWGSLAGTLATRFLSEQQLLDWGWRIPFIFGGVLGAVGVYLRKKLSETPTFQNMKGKITENFIPVREVFKNYKVNTLRAGAICLVTAVVVALMYLYLPVYLQIFFKFKPYDAFLINSSFVVFYALFILPFALICDKWGDKRVFSFSCLGLALFSLPLFLSFQEKTLTPVLLCYFVVSLLTSGLTVSSITLLAKSFPAKVRYSGAALSYNLAFGLIGGFTPLISTTLIQVTGFNAAPALYLTFVALIGLFVNIKKWRVYSD